jgi:predicted phage terminase large subunit-like protein
MLTVSPELSPKFKQRIKKKSSEHYQTFPGLKNSEENSIEIDSDELFRQAPAVLLPYQQRFLEEFYKGEFTTYVYEKSRRIGITWAIAALAVLEASKENGGDVIYISTSLDLAKEFLLSVAFWAKNFKIAADEIQEELFKSEKDDIQSLKITFNSGYRVLALPSKPEAVRGRKAAICILDEFAFIESQEAFITAVAPLSIWGTKFIYISTHDGIDNKFNEICEKTRQKELPYHLSKCTFREALEQGLYKRVCLALNQEWSLEKEFEWIKKCYSECNDASQELDVIPSETSVNAIFKKVDFKILEDSELPEYFDYQVIAFDTAATPKQTSCYTVGIVMGKLENNFYILDFLYTRSDALKTQEFLIRSIQKHGQLVPVFVELECASQSLLWFHNSLKPSLPGYRIQAVKPEGSKLIRAVPVAEKVKDGHVFLKKSKAWNQEFLNNINKFDGTPGVPLVTDLGDALSLAFSEVNKGLKGLQLSGVVVPKQATRRR